MSDSDISPDLDTVIEDFVRSGLLQTNFGMPGRVLSYDRDDRTVDVQPLFMRVERPEDVEVVLQLPQIQRVPVAFPNGGGFSLTWNLEAGDLVWLAFSQRSLDTWIGGDGSEVDPVQPVIGDLTDAVATPGIRPFARPIPQAATSGFLLSSDDGARQIELSDDGITIQSDTINLQTGNSSNNTVARGNVLVQYLTQLFTWASTHTHTSAPPGNPTTPPVAPPPTVDGQISSEVNIT